MSRLTEEEWGLVVDSLMSPQEIWWGYQDALWLARLLQAKYDLLLPDLTGCLDSGLV